MHPAYSVIVFTTASGAGYGLLVLLLLAGAAGWIGPERMLGLVGFGIAFGLVTAGLLSSTFHLGRPERAWRALSQWRSSWLSREGVAAIATYGPAGLAAIGWVFFAEAGGWFAVLAVLGAGLALATVYCTGQIYQSLPTIPHWHQALTTPVYLMLSLSTGALLLNAVLRAFGEPADWIANLAMLLLFVALMVKLAWWHDNDRRQRRYSAAAATGLGGTGTVRLLDPPHTQPNYVMREMGYVVGRRHARRLRAITVVLLFVLPLVLTLLSLADAPVLALASALAAVLSAGVGVIAERWLFFAEAEHVSMLYYGRGAV